MYVDSYYTEQQVVILYGIATVFLLGPTMVIGAAILGYLTRKLTMGAKSE